MTRLAVGRNADRYVTTCSVCRRGVFEGQTWQWSTDPIGIVHTDCVKPADRPRSKVW